MKIEILKPSCNPETIRDGRGGIFSWVPQDKIVEFNLLYILPGKVRGHHYHPEFTEYFLVTGGEGALITKDSENEPEEVIHISKGMCARMPRGVSHTIYAITPLTAVAMLTKPWDDCNPPIIQTNV
jgi:mannose-6-phosphate isomerase-like protein (cupin superfamily)